MRSLSIRRLSYKYYIAKVKYECCNFVGHILGTFIVVSTFITSLQHQMKNDQVYIMFLIYTLTRWMPVNWIWLGLGLACSSSQSSSPSSLSATPGTFQSQIFLAVKFWICFTLPDLNPLHLKIKLLPLAGWFLPFSVEIKTVWWIRALPSASPCQVRLRSNKLRFRDNIFNKVRLR